MSSPTRALLLAPFAPAAMIIAPALALALLGALLGGPGWEFYVLGTVLTISIVFVIPAGGLVTLALALGAWVLRRDLAQVSPWPVLIIISALGTASAYAIWWATGAGAPSWIPLCALPLALAEGGAFLWLRARTDGRIHLPEPVSEN